MNLLHHFRKCWQYRHVKTGLQVRQVRFIQASSDYVMGTDRRRFEIVGIRGVRNYPADHLVLRARLLICPTEVVLQYDVGVLPSQMVIMNGVREDTVSYQMYTEVGSGHGTGDRLTSR